MTGTPITCQPNLTVFYNIIIGEWGLVHILGRLDSRSDVGSIARTIPVPQHQLLSEGQLPLVWNAHGWN